MQDTQTKREVLQAWIPSDPFPHAVSESTGVVLAQFADLDDAKQFAAAPELLKALRECVTDDGALCKQLDGTASEQVEALNRRIDYITEIALAAIAAAT